MSINVVVLQGRLTDHPELKYTPSNVAVTNFTLAVDRAYVKSGAERQVDFINFEAWRNTAEFICKHFRKGQMIAVRGYLKVDRYEDNEGNKRTAYKVVAEEVSFCGEKKEASEEAEQPAVYTPPVEAKPYISPVPFPVDEFEEIAPMSDEDLPF